MNNLKVHFALEGFYTIRRKKSSDNSTVSENIFHNIITNLGLDLIGRSYSASYNMLPECSVGTNNASEQVTDTDVNAPLARTHSNAGMAGTFVEEDIPNNVPAYWKYTLDYTFSTGSATGNLSEISVGQEYIDTSSIQHHLAFSRALIRDGAGVPTTITVLADEYLEVTYELRAYIDKTQYSMNVTLNGTPYTGQQGTYDISQAPNARPFTNGYPTAQYSDSSLMGGVNSTLYDAPPVDLTAYGAGGAGNSNSATSGAGNGPYVQGSHQYTLTFSFTTSGTFNGPIYSVTTRGAFTKARFVFDAPGGPTKLSNNQAQCSIQFSWSRFTPP